MIGVAMVGLGEIGLGAHLPAILRSDTVRLVAVADASPERRRHAEASLPAQVAIVDGLPEVLAREDVDAVVLATPPWATPELTVTAARSGRFVLAEKPVATSVEHARVYGALTTAERDRIQVGLTYRHDPAMLELRRVIELGELGDSLLVRAHVYDEARTEDERHRELIERTLRHGSPVVHEGAHVFDWLRMLLAADPALEDAWSLRTEPALPAPNLVGARLGYGGAVALVEFGWFTRALPPTAIEVLGDRGRAVLDGRTFTLTVTTAEGERVVDPPGDRVARCFDLQLARFSSLAAGVRPRPEPSLEDGIAALTISELVAARAGAAVAEGAEVVR